MMNSIPIGILVAIVEIIWFWCGLRIGRAGERDAIVRWAWNQPRARSTPQIILDIMRGAHRRDPYVAEPRSVRPKPSLPYGYVEQLRKIAATPEKEGYVTRVSFNGGMTPRSARLILETLETLSGGNPGVL
jgi:hypothetical protein